MSDVEHVRTMWAQDTASAGLGITCLGVGVSSADTIPSKTDNPAQHPEQTPRGARNIPSKTEEAAQTLLAHARGRSRSLTPRSER